MAGVPTVACGDRQGQGRRLYRVDGHYPPLCLGHDLLGHDQHVAGLDGASLGLGGIHYLDGQVIPGFYFRHPFDADNADFRRHG